mgnify:CR=1 FL=1
MDVNESDLSDLDEEGKNQKEKAIQVDKLRSILKGRYKFK